MIGRYPSGYARQKWDIQLWSPGEKSYVSRNRKEAMNSIIRVTGRWHFTE